jgi:hypothetical protein
VKVFLIGYEESIVLNFVIIAGESVNDMRKTIKGLEDISSQLLGKGSVETW